MIEIPIAFGGVQALSAGQQGGELVGGEAVAGDNKGVFPLFALLHLFDVAVPFVFQPGGLNVIGAAAVDDHHLCRCQGVENVWLVLFAHLTAQALTAEKHAIALFGQVQIQLLCLNAILSTFNTVCQVAVLVADKNVIGL